MAEPTTTPEATQTPTVAPSLSAEELWTMPENEQFKALPAASDNPDDVTQQRVIENGIEHVHARAIAEPGYDFESFTNYANKVRDKIAPGIISKYGGGAVKGVVNMGKDLAAAGVGVANAVSTFGSPIDSPARQVAATTASSGLTNVAEWGRKPIDWISRKVNPAHRAAHDRADFFVDHIRKGKLPWQDPSQLSQWIESADDALRPVQEAQSGIKVAQMNRITNPENVQLIASWLNTRNPEVLDQLKHNLTMTKGERLIEARRMMAQRSAGAKNMDRSFGKGAGEHLTTGTDPVYAMMFMRAAQAAKGATTLAKTGRFVGEQAAFGAANAITNPDVTLGGTGESIVHQIILGSLIHVGAAGLRGVASKLSGTRQEAKGTSEQPTASPTTTSPAPAETLGFSKVGDVVEVDGRPQKVVSVGEDWTTTLEDGSVWKPRTENGYAVPKDGGFDYDQVTPPTNPNSASATAAPSTAGVMTPPAEAATAPAAAVTTPPTEGGSSPPAGTTSPKGAELPPGFTGMRNAITDAERAARGLPPREAVARRAFGTVWDEAMAELRTNPNRGADLTAEINAKPRPVTDVEDAILTAEQIKRQQDHTDAANDVNNATTTEAQAAASLRLAAAREALVEVYNADAAAGTATARGLNARRILKEDDHSVGAMLREAQAIKKGPLTEQEQAKIEKLSAEITAAEAEAVAAAADQQARAADIETKAEQARVKSAAASTMKQRKGRSNTQKRQEALTAILAELEAEARAELGSRKQTTPSQETEAPPVAKTPTPRPSAARTAIEKAQDSYLKQRTAAVKAAEAAERQAIAAEDDVQTRSRQASVEHAEADMHADDVIHPDDAQKAAETRAPELTRRVQQAGERAGHEFDATHEDHPGHPKNDVTENDRAGLNADGTPIFFDSTGLLTIAKILQQTAKDVRSFTQFAVRAVQQFGAWIKPHLQSLWNAARRGVGHLQSYLRDLWQIAKSNRGSIINPRGAPPKTSTASPMVKLGAVLIGRGKTSYADWVHAMHAAGHPVTPANGRSIFNAARTLFADLTRTATARAAADTRPPAEPELQPDGGRDVGWLRKVFNHHAETARTLDEAITKTHADAEKAYPGITWQEAVGDAVDYGKPKLPNPEELAKKKREYRRMAQLSLSIDRAKDNKPPLKSGVQRDKPTADIRAMQSELKDLMDKNGIETRDPETQLASRKAATITRLQNAIEDMTRKLDEHARTGKVTPRSKAAPLPPDTTIDDLTARRDALRKELSRVMGHKSMSLEAYGKHLDRLTAQYKRYAADPAVQAAEAAARKARTAENAAERQADATTRAKMGALGDAKLEFLRLKEKLRMQQRSGLEKTLSYIPKWGRTAIISGMNVLVKLSSIALENYPVRFIENLIGKGLSKLPGIRTVAERAKFESGFSLAAEARAFVNSWKLTVAEAGRVLRTGKTNMERTHIKPDVHEMEPFIGDYVGHLHGLLKLPSFAAEYFRSLEYLTETFTRQGLDVTDPVVRLRMEKESVENALKGKLMEKNFMSDAWKSGVRTLTNSKSEAVRNTMGVGAKTLFPVTHIPTNFILRVADAVGGLPIGITKMLVHTMRGTLRTMTPEQADTILRHLKRGSIGPALLAMGYFYRKHIGGYHTENEHRSKSDVQSHEIRIGGMVVPKAFTHHPVFETLQIGATFGRVMDHVTLSTGQHGTVPDALAAAAAGLYQQVPFFNDNFARMLSRGEAGTRARADFVTSRIVPRSIVEIAQGMDRKPGSLPLFGGPFPYFHPWQPSDIYNRRVPAPIRQGLPGLRQDLDLARPSRH